MHHLTQFSIRCVCRPFFHVQISFNQVYCKNPYKSSTSQKINLAFTVRGKALTIEALNPLFIN